MPEAPRILIVEDDAFVRHLLVGYVRRGGYQCSQASDGEEALRKVAAWRPDLVLLDVVMPGIDGFEVLERLRAAPTTRDLPVVVLTALDGDSEVQRVFEVGADDFLRKPFREAELLARIRAQLRVREYTVALAQKARDARMLQALTQALASSLDMTQILELVLQRIADAVHVEGCAILLVRDDGSVALTVGGGEGEGAAGVLAALRALPALRETLGRLEPVRAPLPGAEGAEPRAVELVPLVTEGKPLGVLCLPMPAWRTLEERESTFCDTAANATATALRNAHLVQQLQNETRANRSARKEAERRAERLEPYLDLFNATADCLLVVEARGGRVLFVNPRVAGVLGYTPEEVRLMRATQVVHDEDRPRLRALLAGFARGEYPTLDLRVVRRDGAVRTISVTTAPLSQKDRAVVCAFRDVTEERELAAEFARTKDFLWALIESSPDAIVAADPRGTMLVWNSAAERICGIPREQMVGLRNVESIYPPGVARQLMRLIRDEPHGGPGRLESWRTELLDAQGQRIPVQLSAALVYEHGAEAGTVGIFSDLRERLRIERTLEDAQQRLEVSERQALLAELAGAAAHELNQPLQAVMAYAQLLQRRAGADTALGQASSTLVQETERMAEIVRKLGRLTHYETKGYAGHTRILDLDRSTRRSSTPPGGEG